MKRIIYSVAMSLDGYIAGPHGEFDWIPMDPDVDFAALMNRFDTVLLGRKTYEITQAHSAGAPPMPGTRSIVFSRTLRQADHPNVMVVGADMQRVLSQLQSESGKDIWLMGGGELFRSLLEIRMVDAVEVTVVPVLLGGGLPCLPSPAPRAKLALVANRLYPKTGSIRLEYAVQYT